MSIVPHDKVPNRKEAQLIIKQLAAESKIAYTRHCKERMKERGVTTPEIINCLMKGSVTEDPWLNHQNGGGYETTMEKNTAGRRLKIAVCIKFDESLLVITVINR